MSEFETGYQPISSFYDDEGEEPPAHIIHAVPNSNKGIYYLVTTKTLE